MWIYNDKRNFTPNVYRIARNTLLLTNVTEITWSCTANGTVANRTVVINQTESIIQMRCDCDVYVRHWIFPRLYHECHHGVKDTYILHCINLRLLAEFFELDKVMSIFAQDTFFAGSTCTIAQFTNRQYRIWLSFGRKAGGSFATKQSHANDA